MLKYLFICAALATAAASSFAQSTAATGDAAATPPEAAASKPAKHKWIKKLRSHKPGASAVNPETSPDKKGGQ